jgi:hypothetical protein
MTDEDIETLKQNDQKVVRLFMKDREIVTATVLFVSESEEDVIVDLLCSTAAERYEKSDVQPAFQYAFKDIERVAAMD